MRSPSSITNRTLDFWIVGTQSCISNLRLHQQALKEVASEGSGTSQGPLPACGHARGLRRGLLSIRPGWGPQNAPLSAPDQGMGLRMGLWSQTRTPKPPALPTRSTGLRDWEGEFGRQHDTISNSPVEFLGTRPTSQNVI